MRFAVVVSTGLIAAWVAIAFAPARWRAGLWTVVILACVVPWTGWVGHEHWAKVNWVPFSTAPGPLRLRDLWVNLLLYVPLGWFLAAGQRSTGWIVPAAGVVSAVLSLLTEWTQVYAHGRFPTMTDVAMNTIGGLVGAALASRINRPAPPGARPGGIE